MLMTPVFANSTLNHSSDITSSILPQMLLIGGFMGLFYLLILRPQAQQQKEKEELLKNLQIGDVVYTSGGIVGKITQFKESFCQLEISANTHIYAQKEAVVDLVPKGSLKSIGFE